MWVAMLQAAEEWGMPPWEIEEEIPVVWWDRWRAYREEEAKARPKPKKKGGGKPLIGE